MVSINKTTINLILTNDEYAKAASCFLDDIANYADFVMRLENRQTFIKNYSAAEYLEEMQNLDTKRTSHHDAAITAISALNNIAQRLEIPPVYDDQTTSCNRANIAYAIFAYYKDRLNDDIYGTL